MSAPISTAGIASQPRFARNTTPRDATLRHPLFQLLRYVGPHKKYAVLTAGFGVAGFLLSFAYPWIVGSVVDLIAIPAGTAGGAERAQKLSWLTQLSVLTAVLHAIVVYGRGHFNVHLGDGIVNDLRRRLFEHLQRLGTAFYGAERVGGIVSRVLHDVQAATGIIYGGLIVVVLDAAQLVLAFALLSNISWKLTMACVVMFPLYGLVFALLNPRVQEASNRLQKHLSWLSGNLSERVAGQALIKTYTAESREAARFSAEVGQHHALVVQQSHHGHLVASYGEILVHIGTTVVIGYGGWLAFRGELTPGLLTRFLGYVIILYGPVRRFAELNIAYQSSLAAMRRVFHLLAVEPAIVEPARPHLSPPREGNVCFERVAFQFVESELDAIRHGEPDGPSSRRSEWVLQDVNFNAAPGERIAIVGPSGAGKTTLVSLIPRLHDVTRGRILIDGIDVRDYSLDALRGAIAIVQQDSFLFSGSIRDNILYGRPDAPEQAMLDAARAANVHEFVARLPEGYSSLIGERGINLSGGQRQRISIARALLKDPKVLILDEATSALDAESEGIVQEALERLMRGRTCFIVAHRLSTVRTAQRILVLERGRIAESGTHAELMRTAGTYRRLVRRQNTA